MTGAGQATDERWLQVAARRVAAAVGGDLVGIFRRASAHRPLLLCAGVGWRDDAIGRATVSASRTAPVGRALTAGGPVVIADLRRLRGAAAAAGLLHDHGVVSGVQVAIGGCGVLGVYARAHRRFGDDEVGFLRGVAETLAIAGDRAKAERELREEVAHLRADRERIASRTVAEIAQLLHDDALQSMLAGRQYLASALAEPARHDDLLRAQESVQRAIRELRAVVSDLHPAALAGERLEDAVEAMAARAAELGVSGVTVEIGVQPSDEQASLLLSVIRELLANIVRHARAARAGIQLRRRDDRLVLEVWDDGRGMDAARPQQALAEGRIGLASVARRAQALGGDCEVDSRPGEGTRVRVWIPCSPGQRAG